MKKSVNILCFVLFVLIVLLTIKTYKETTLKIYGENNNYNFSKIFTTEQLTKYCMELLKEDLSLLENENYKPKNKFKSLNNYNRDSCINILDYGNMSDMSWLGSYNSKKSKIILDKFIKNTEQQFAYDVKFIKAFKNETKVLNETSNKIVNSEFPNPYEGRETRLYIYNRLAALNYAQIDILRGFIAEYCLKNFEDSCYNKIYNRFGRIN